MAFTAKRRIGIGDLQVVRASLLQVLCVTTHEIIHQVEEALKAATKLKKTLRIYINSEQLSNEEERVLIHEVFARFRDHDLMLVKCKTREDFKWIVNRCDIVLLPHGATHLPLHKEIMREWTSTGEREMISCNDRMLALDEIKKKHAHLYENDDTYFYMFMGA